MAGKNVTELRNELAEARKRYDESVRRADELLEAEIQLHSQTVRKSEEPVAALENQLEFMEALEQERMAKQVRTELADAIEAHQRTVDGANWRLKDAMYRHTQTILAAGQALSQAYNKAAGRRE